MTTTPNEGRRGTGSAKGSVRPALRTSIEAREESQ